MSFWRLNRGRIAYFGGLIVAIIVGLVIGGGTGSPAEDEGFYDDRG